MLTTIEDIIEEAVSFYLKLYFVEATNPNASEQTSPTKSICSLIKSTLTPEEKQQLDKPITQKEIQKALEKLENGKTPGIDGLPPEFYKTF